MLDVPPLHINEGPVARASASLRENDLMIAARGKAG